MSSQRGVIALPHRPFRLVSMLAAASLLAWLTAASVASAEEWQPDRLWTAVSGKTIWVIGASKPEPGPYPVIRMWVGAIEPRLETPHPSRNLPPIAGDIIHLGADRDGLHVLFSDLSVRDYSADRGGMAGPRWRDVSDDPPLAWGGDSSRTVLWALARTNRLTSASTAPSTQAGERDDASAPMPPSVGPLTVMELRGGFWRALGSPKDADGAEHYWVTGHQGRVWLFWQTDGQVWSAAGLAVGQSTGTKPATEAPTRNEDHEARPEPGGTDKPPSPQAATASTQPEGKHGPPSLVEWSAAQIVCETDGLRTGWAGGGSEGPVFVAGREAKANRVRLHLYVRQGDDWVADGAARDGTELLEVDPRTSGVCVAAGRLLVARPSREKGLELGVGEVAPSPSVRFSPLAAGTAQPPEAWSWRDGVFLAVLLVLMTAVMWSRREQMIKPLALPAGLVLAPVLRRMLATIVDALPAMVVVMPFVISTIPATAWPLDASPFGKIEMDPETEDRLLNYYYGFVLLYGLWCLLWELLLGTTPGKLMFGCRVLTTQISRPTPRQIIWRNALRVVEVGVGASGWIVTLMMLVMLTRNRQRIGDLLAGTIVVTLGPVQPNQPSGQDDQHQPPLGS